MDQQTKKIYNKKEMLLESWIQFQAEDESLRDDLMTKGDLKIQSAELLEVMLKALETGNYTDTESEEFEQVHEVISEISISRARQGYSPRDTGMFVLSLKEAFIKYLKEEYKDNIQIFYEEVLKINKLIDKLSIISFETYIKGREEVILRQRDEITEISTPVIKVWDGILALPIIGTLDSARTQVVMENLLVEIVNTGSSFAILDISGVPAVDSLVAQHLIKTVSATRLMGAECIISGIRPEIAQTMVHLGIDLTDIETKSTLASALKYALKLMNLKVTNSTAR